jgi:hypothetical protein
MTKGQEWHSIYKIYSHSKYANICQLNRYRIVRCQLDKLLINKKKMVYHDSMFQIRSTLLQFKGEL